MTYNGPTIFKDAGGEGALPGDNVRMVLDTNALELGPELVTNGGFDTDTGWGLGAGWSISNGVLSGSSASGAAISNNLGLSESKKYMVEFEVISCVSGSAFVNLGGNFQANVSAVGKYKYIISPGGANDSARIAGNSFTGTIDNVSVREITGLHASQTSTALQPVLGRSPKERRNVLNSSQGIESPWVKDGIQWTPADGEGMSLLQMPDTSAGGNRAYLGPNAPSTVQKTVTLSFSAGSVAGSTDLLELGFIGHPTGNGTYRFDPATGQFPVKPAGAVTYVIQEGNRWRVKIELFRAHDGFSSYTNLKVVDASGTSFGANTGGVYFGRVSLSVGKLADEGAYQSVKANGLDITEPGVPSYSYLRYDHVDDKLPQVYPEAKTGDLLICGRNGSWIDRDVSVAAGGSLSVISGKDSPKTPGIAPALGDIVGSLHAPRTLNDYEIAKLTEYWQERGAKGLLVPSGVELVTNGDFSNGTTGWSPARNATLTDDGGILGVATNSSTYNASGYQQLVLEPGVPHLVKTYCVAEGNDARISVNVSPSNVSDTFFLSQGLSTGQSFVGVIIPTVATCYLHLVENIPGPTKSQFNNVSLQKLVIQ